MCMDVVFVLNKSIRAWEVSAASPQHVSHWRHGHHNVKVVGAFVDEVLPDCLPRWG